MNFTQFSKNGTSGKATVYKGQGQDPTRTLFASGLPNDITERDFYLLFHDFQGYEGAVIKRQPSSTEETVWYPKSPVAFLRFSTTDYARTVMHQFQSFPLDQKVPNYKLRLQFAKTNTRCRNKAIYHNPIRKR